MTTPCLVPFSAQLANSRMALCLLLLMSGLLLLALSALALDVALWLVLPATVSAVMFLRQGGMIRGAPLAFRVDMRGELYLAQGRGERRMSMLGNCVVWPVLVVLHLVDETGRKHVVLVWRDAVASEVHRALRVYVCWHRAN